MFRYASVRQDAGHSRQRAPQVKVVPPRLSAVGAVWGPAGISRVATAKVPDNVTGRKTFEIVRDQLGA